MTGSKSQSQTLFCVMMIAEIWKTDEIVIETARLDK